MIGATDPAQSPVGTIRSHFTVDVEMLFAALLLKLQNGKYLSGLRIASLRSGSLRVNSGYVSKLRQQEVMPFGMASRPFDCTS